MTKKTDGIPDPRSLKRPEGEGPQKVYLVGIGRPGESMETTEEALAELGRLAEAAGGTVVGHTVFRGQPDSRYRIGSGKAAEVAREVADAGADLAVFEGELQPAHVRNLEELLEVTVLDRTQLILDIFAQRALTREGRLQVEMAQLNYLLPRLAGSGTSLSRLGGGIGTRGPGETKLETDRRRVRRRIADLKRQLAEVKKHRELLRETRRRMPVCLVALVGYTNAGKSSLLNALGGVCVSAADRLFDTLDPATRRVKLPGGETVLLTDTVGFIRNLPHQLVAAFRATLEEVTAADLLLHVVDASQENRDDRIRAVEQVLAGLDAQQTPSLLVYNKVDLLGGADACLDWPGRAVYVSAATGEGVSGLLEAIAEILAAERVRETFSIPYRQAGLLEMVHGRGRILSETHLAEGITVEAEMPAAWAGRLRSRLKAGDTEPEKDLPRDQL
ncbi:MAG TPA: GTPase HflX [Spirochaetia bacterium]|nr:GTPase HflX [Spirochaetia bacterium]